MKYYDFLLSGHAHRGSVFLKLLNVEHDSHLVDLVNGEHKQPEFLALNPLGEVPVLVDGDLVLRDSTAILVYLAKRYDASNQWLPDDADIAAQIQSWLSVSSKEVYLGPCAARLNKVFGAPFDHEQAVAKAHKVLSELFEPHLAEREWLVSDHATIADIANYSYIAAAHEGEVDLSAYPNVKAWLARIEALEGFVKMPAANA
ncbi:glutathione S-transferase family protein [Marinomonas epiphytica]